MGKQPQLSMLPGGVPGELGSVDLGLRDVEVLRRSCHVPGTQKAIVTVDLIRIIFNVDEKSRFLLFVGFFVGLEVEN